MKKILKIAIIFFFAAVFLISLKMIILNNQNYTTVCFKENCFLVEIAKTQAERARGLMFREGLEQNKGMLFVFDREGAYSFWMKNTLIPLDIIWMNGNKEVVFISKDSQPCKENQCPSIIPEEKALYVLEVNAGIAEKIGLLVGDKAMFDLK